VHHPEGRVMFRENRKLPKRCMIAFVIIIFSVSAIATDEDPADCTIFFDNPYLYNDCLKKKSPPAIGSIPKNPSEKINDESCSSCDARQRQQVKERLKKKKSGGEK
jgi:hypothetical protein